MFPTAFDEENGILHPPEGMSSEECETISVWRGVEANGSPVVITCWKPTQEELDEIMRTKRVWLFIYGYTMPPAAVGGLSPFVKP